MTTKAGFAALAFAQFIALAVSGCTQVAGGIAQGNAQTPLAEQVQVIDRMPSPPPGKYRQLAANYIAKTMPKTTSLQGAQISTLRLAVAPQIGDWVACVSFSGKQDGFIAVFYTGGKILSARRQVAVDHCEQASGYTLLPRPVLKKDDDDEDDDQPEQFRQQPQDE